MTLERWAPGLAALIAIVSVLILQGQGPVAELLASIDLVAVMYVALGVFTLSAVLTLGLFGIVLAPSDGFMAKRRGTAAYRTFGEYVARAFFLALAAAVATGGLLAARGWPALNPAVGAVIPLWWALSAGALASVLRTYTIFLIWMRSPLPAPPGERVARPISDLYSVGPIGTAFDDGDYGRTDFVAVTFEHATAHVPNPAAFEQVG